MSCAHGIASCSACYYDTRQHEPIAKQVNTDFGAVPEITAAQRERATRAVAAHVPAEERADVLDMLGIGEVAS